MKTGLGIQNKIKRTFTFWNILKFQLRKFFLGFDVANEYLRKANKESILFILKKNGAKIGFNCDIEPGITFLNCRDYRNFIVGNNCHIGHSCIFDLRDKIHIEDNVVISMECCLVTHLDIGYSHLNKVYKASQAPIKISKNCYLGARSTILKGVVLKRNVIIGAGSVVLKNISMNSLAAGVPASIIKKIGR